MEEKLNELIRIIKENNVVERLVAAADTEERLSVYRIEKEKLSEKLESFKKEAEEIYRSSSYVIDDYCIQVEDAIPLCLVCIMTGWDDSDLIGSYIDLPKTLIEVEGDLAEIAKDLADFLKSECFSGYEDGNDESQIERFFG